MTSTTTAPTRFERERAAQLRATNPRHRRGRTRRAARLERRARRLEAAATGTPVGTETEQLPPSWWARLRASRSGRRDDPARERQRERERDREGEAVQVLLDVVWNLLLVAAVLAVLGAAIVLAVPAWIAGAAAYAIRWQLVPTWGPIRWRPITVAGLVLAGIGAGVWTAGGMGWLPGLMPSWAETPARWVGLWIAMQPGIGVAVAAIWARVAGGWTGLPDPAAWTWLPWPAARTLVGLPELDTAETSRPAEQAEPLHVEGEW